MPSEPLILNRQQVVEALVSHVCAKRGLTRDQI